MYVEQIKTARIQLPERTEKSADHSLRVATGATAQKKYAHKKNGEEGISIDGVNLSDNSVEARKALARKQAMRVVSSAYGSEKAMDKNMADIRAEIRRLNKETGALKEEQQENAKKLSELKEKYGITADSEEEKGLQKAVLRLNNPENPMTDEEYEALTEYQKEALYYASSSYNNERQLAQNEAAVVANKQAHTDMETERNKSHAMIDAEKEAEALIAASEKDAVAQLTQEAVDHIDEEAKEEQEKAQARKEEEKEAKKEAAKKAEQEAQQQELIARIKEHAGSDAAQQAGAVKNAARRERARADGMDMDAAVTGQAVQAADNLQTQAKVSSEVTNILNKLSLLTEDIKGSSIDGQI